MEPTTGPVRHRVEVTSVSAWSVDGLGFDALGGVTVFDWLATPGQRLAEAVGGAVFHDGLRELTALRQRLQWYPDDVWRFVLAGQWLRVAQEEAFPGRCAEVGDDVGARVVTARIVRDLMRLCLLTGRRYVPYSKWLGSAFDALPVAGDLRPVLHRALTASTWRECERHLAFAYEMVGEQHNRLALTPPLDVATRNYYERPYRVIDGGRFSDRPAAGHHRCPDACAPAGGKCGLVHRQHRRAVRAVTSPGRRRCDCSPACDDPATCDEVRAVSAAAGNYVSEVTSTRGSLSSSALVIERRSAKTTCLALGDALVDDPAQLERDRTRLAHRHVVHARPWRRRDRDAVGLPGGILGHPDREPFPRVHRRVGVVVAELKQDLVPAEYVAIEARRRDVVRC